MKDAEQELLDASAVLEALRPQADIALGSTNPDDQPIVQAWAAALARFRKACDAWSQALQSGR